MKKQLFSLALLLGLSASFADTSFAADGRPAQGREQRQDRDQGRRGQNSAQDRQRRTDKLAKELDLSSKQKSKVEKIFQEQQQQMQALRGRSGPQDRSQQQSEFKRIHESTDKKLKDVLSKKQYAQLEAKRQERLRQMGSRQGERRERADRRDFSGRS
ncbi:hypothetical protein [Hymenobacter glacieicola]|uniref:DUF4890 domain-containing protein n=1 Tax=Hymenobacter glacieicola TaxID=1562124 RepID=A0ABQ1WKW6_9BACT|nr:hypothetical protein [Hymenobacter glacieicola]GGG34835.1 hypothetical protein GCM10011378_09020 [Hymenobacter glacieicola]